MKQTAVKQAGRNRSYLAGMALACGALSVGMAAVLVVTSQSGSFQVASSDPLVAGVSGLARPHEPLDRAPGEPLELPFMAEKVAHAGSSVVLK
jgi:hypothetical protein